MTHRPDDPSAPAAKVIVFYLLWGPLGHGPAESFARSYREHRGGIDHRLVIIYNGLDRSGSRTDYEHALAGIAHGSLVIDRPVLDLDAYRLAAAAHPACIYCFLNSYSTFRHPAWLRLLCGAVTDPTVGIAGATACLHSLRGPAVPYRDPPLPLSKRTWMGLTRRFHHLRMRAWFPSFPNPHVRTNAFVMRHGVMTELHWPRCPTKWDALRLESGRRSITRQVRARGLRSVVVGRDGRAYDEPEWSASSTYRYGDQANLLVEDNQTRAYTEADADERRRLTRLAWGSDAR